MNKTLHKAIMIRSGLKNKFLKTPNTFNAVTSKKHLPYCINLLRREKRRYFENLLSSFVIYQEEYIEQR